METLVALQDKIEQLIAIVKDLKSENEHLLQENKKLEKKIESIGFNLEHTEIDLKELTEEKSRTKIAINDLIKNIDSFMRVE